MLTDGKIMACKQMTCNPANLVNSWREAEIFVKLSKEPHIAQFSGDMAYNPINASLLLYMSYYPGGDLKGVIMLCDLSSTTVDPVVATHWALEIVKGVMKCHEHGVIHRDIKPKNGECERRAVAPIQLWPTKLTQAVRPQKSSFSTGFPWLATTDSGL
ncbi:kinase-like protein [Parathielavia hyrcaniae]|uniref:mitogen-activated protein kinase kinase n=1 Tax=Parathielavia hyrcaniae TaxID=113614 RepID=A0AAN6T3N0_9PEZI|nr:kinase-like protein [Parathielavia hyrcaniae]